MNYLEIKSTDDKLNVAKILVANGYTVWLTTIKDGNKPKAVIAYEKTKKENQA